MTRRRMLVATACAAGAAVLVAGGILVSTDSPEKAEVGSASQSVPTRSAAVEKGDLRGTTTKTGTVSGTAGAKVPVGVQGTVTSIPEVGSVVKPRDVLYRIDNTPVTYFAGALPQWRAFNAGMTDGPDVKQLEQNLHDWGYLTEVATEHFDWHTSTAIRQWQKATSQPQTGAVDEGRIWFGEGDQVVADRSAAVGDVVARGAAMYSTTGTTKVVTVDLPVGTPLATVGGMVEIRLPAGGSTPGKVTKVGGPATDDDGKTTVPTTIGFDDPEKAGDLDRVEVTVDFVSDTRKNVLSVPVTALGAKASGGFVVEVVGKGDSHKAVTVTVGLFAGDRVEVTGGSLEQGQKVVVPA